MKVYIDSYNKKRVLECFVFFIFHPILLQPKASGFRTIKTFITVGIGLICKLRSVFGKRAQYWLRFVTITTIHEYLSSNSRLNRTDEGQTLETPAFLLFTVANLRFRLSC